MRAKLFVAVICLTVLTGFALVMGAGLPQRAVTTNVAMRHYLDMGLPEQDVFIEVGSAHSNTPDPSFLGPRAIFLPNLFRVTAARALTPADLSASLYAANTIVPHDPYQLGPNPLGPNYKGEALGFTLREWLAARGSGTYAVTGADADLNLAFEQLVAGGRYALWCGAVAVPKVAEAERACGAADGSQNQFSADTRGNAAFHLPLKALPASTQAAPTMLTLTYERDVDSPDGERGGFGLTSHVQLLYVFPP